MTTYSGYVVGLLGLAIALLGYLLNRRTAVWARLATLESQTTERFDRIQELERLVEQLQETCQQQSKEIKRQQLELAQVAVNMESLKQQHTQELTSVRDERDSEREENERLNARAVMMEDLAREYKRQLAGCEQLTAQLQARLAAGDAHP